MNEYREQLIEAAERAYRQEQAREAEFRAFVCAHLGLPPGTPNQQVEAITRATDLEDLTDEHLTLLVHFGLGLPPGYSLTEDQIDMAAEALLRNGIQS
jgi:hypothetical protein